MSWKRLLIPVVLLTLAADHSIAQADESARLPNFDTRLTTGVIRTAVMDDRQRAAEVTLKQRIPGARIVWNSLISSPCFIFNESSFLSGPDSAKRCDPGRSPKPWQ